MLKGEKILICQAGVGVVATVVGAGVRCPQSIYIYKPSEGAHRLGYSNEFLLACLVSRTMNFIVMKRFGEIDPARAFAKLTHARIQALPIPRLNNSTLGISVEIGGLVRHMLTNQQLGSATDHTIEFPLCRLWGIVPGGGRYVNGFFSNLPDGRAVRDLFPDGAPSAVSPPMEAH